MKVLILAGGLGTRLRNTLGDTPKPLAPIRNKPFLEYLLRFIAKQEFRDVIIATGYRAEEIERKFGDGSAMGLQIQYAFEKELLGTGGAVKFAEPMIQSDDFFVMNGDTYFEVDLKEMSRFHKAHGGLATIALSYQEDTHRYGRVIVNDFGKILSFEEKMHEKNMGGYINGGIYVFNKNIFQYIPSNVMQSIEKQTLPSLAGANLYGFISTGYFIDIGIPEDYEKAQRELPIMGGI